MATGGMGGRGGRTADEVDAELADEEADLLRRSSAGDLAALRPGMSDKAAFDTLIAAVQASTQANEDVAAFQERLKGLGTAILKAAKTAHGFLA